MKLLTKTVYLLFIIALTVLVSCSNDDSPKEVSPKYKSELFVNTWCTIGEFGESTVMTLANTHKASVNENSLDGDKFMSISFSGTWMYYPNNNILVIQFGYQSSSDNYSIHTTSYKVRELKDGKMVLVNQETGSVETFVRLTDSLNVSVGEDIDHLTVGYTNLYTSNPDVISIDSSGSPKIVGVGTAYLILMSDSESCALELTVLHQSQVFVGYLGKSVEDILEVYGEPDVIGTIGVNPAILYNKNLEEGISAVQVQYDGLSLEVTRILVQYSLKNIWDSDVKFISSWLNKEGEFYFPEHSMLESDFLISAFESDGKYYVSYNDQVYYNENKHYAPKKIIEIK